MLYFIVVEVVVVVVVVVVVEVVYYYQIVHCWIRLVYILYKKVFKVDSDFRVTIYLKLSTSFLLLKYLYDRHCLL